MSRCELTGKGPAVKNLINHSNIKTKSLAFPNVQHKRLFSRTLNQMVRLYVAASTIRDMEHSGGFDKFVLNCPESKLSQRARSLKARIKAKMKKTKAA